MKQIILSIVLMTGLAFIATSGEAKGDDPTSTKQWVAAEDAVTFTGSWEIVKASPDGMTKGAERLVFQKDGTYAATDKDGRKLWAGSFEIDPTASPKLWGHRPDDGKNKGTDVLGIYELNADSLKMACVVGQRKGKAWVGKDRPKTFDPRTADVVIEMRRAKTGQ